MINIILKRIIRIQNEKQRGATAVEFAIVILLFITIIFGIIEFGLLMYNQHIVTNASREGARYGIVYSFPDRINANDIKATVTSYGSQYIISFGNKDWDVEVRNLETGNQNQGCVTHSDRLMVQASYDYHFLFIPIATKKLLSTAIMICE